MRDRGKERERWRERDRKMEGEKWRDRGMKKERKEMERGRGAG